MSYRIRFTLSDGRTGLWTPTYATREEAHRAIDDRVADTGLAYAVEEVATPDDRLRTLEAELAQLRDAYDAAVQDRDVAKRSVARLEGTLAMVQASWAVSVANAEAARAIAAENLMDAACSHVRMSRAIELGDAMHRAHPSEEWAAYKDSLAASPGGPAKASGGAGGSAHTGPGHQPGAGQGVASRLIVDLGAIEPEGPAKASEGRIRQLEDETAQLRDAYDAAVQDRDVAKRSVARLEGTLAMVQASWAASVASCDAARAITRHHQMRAACSDVSLERAIEIGDAMYLALTTAQPYLAGSVAMGEWEAYKHTLAASRQGPAKASEAPGEGGDSGEGAK